MYFYLRDHPDIYFPEKKELHFFGSDLEFKHDRSEEAYFREYEKRQSEPVVGDASVWYLYSKKAASEIHSFDPNAKIMIMLRNPADMVHAQHAQAVYVGRERIVDFETALDAEPARRAGKLATHELSPKSIFFYSEIANYSEQIERYIELFGRERIHFVIFDDLKADTPAAIDSTLRFLEVDPTFTTDTRPRNKNRNYKNRWLHYLVNDPPPTLSKIVKQAVPVNALRGIKKRLRNINTSTEARPAMSPETRARLNAIYTAEIHRLGELLSRDFTGWLT